MNKSLASNSGIFIMRLALGVMLLAHSLYLKYFIFTLPGTVDFFESLGLPGIFAYLVFVTEIIAGIAIILGVQTRFFAALVIPILLGATWSHWPNGWLFTNTGGGWEYPLFLVFIALAQTGIGGGQFVVSTPSFSAKHVGGIHENSTL